MTTPTQTEYGPEIVVDGVRLPWLKDEPVIVRWHDSKGHKSVTGAWDVKDLDASERWSHVYALLLPASHPASTVAAHNTKHGTQFKYWPGGDEPDDWDGKLALCRNGKTIGFPSYWTRTPNPEWSGQWDIIGYIPKPCAPAAGEFNILGFPAVKAIIPDTTPTNAKMATVADFVPCERTLRMALSAMPSPGHVPGGSKWDTHKACKDAIAALLPKPDRAEELVRGWVNKNGPLAPELADDLLDYTRDLLAQGEIRG